MMGFSGVIEMGDESDSSGDAEDYYVTTAPRINRHRRPFNPLPHRVTIVKSETGENEVFKPEFLS